MMLVSNGSIPSAPTYTIADSATFWALSLKPGQEGSLLWGPINIDLINDDNEQLMYQAHDPENRVFIFQQTPDMSWVAYKLDSGQKAWQTISEGDYNSSQQATSVLSSHTTLKTAVYFGSTMLQPTWRNSNTTHL
jgi:hypothetical protein